MKWQELLTHALSDGVPARAFVVAIVVGTILNLINQGDALLTGAVIVWSKLALTYIVPYVVSTHGAVSARLARRDPSQPRMDP